MKVNLKMSPTIATSVTFTDEEEVTKPRLGINYEGHTLYTPMGLGWYDNNKKGLYSNLYSRSLAALWGVEHRGEQQFGILIQVNPNTVGLKVTVSDGTSYTFNTSSEIQTLYIQPAEDESVKTIIIEDIYGYKSVNYTVPTDGFKTLIMYNSETKFTGTIAMTFTSTSTRRTVYCGGSLEARYTGNTRIVYSYSSGQTVKMVDYDDIYKGSTEVGHLTKPSGGTWLSFETHATVTCGGQSYSVILTGNNWSQTISDYTFEIEEGE